MAQEIEDVYKKLDDKDKKTLNDIGKINTMKLIYRTQKALKTLCYSCKNKAMKRKINSLDDLCLKCKSLKANRDYIAFLKELLVDSKSNKNKQTKGD